MTGFAVYIMVVVVVVVSCTLAPIPQCGGSRERLSHAKDREAGRWGVWNGCLCRSIQFF